MRVRFHIAFVAACLSVAAQGHDSVSALVAKVRADLEHNRGDNRIAKDLGRVRLSERLDDRTVETLQSEGAGPETVAELLVLRDASSRLPRPASPAVPEPAPPPASEQARIWSAAQDNARRHTQSLPDFICGEVVRRYNDSSGKGAWKLADTLALKLTYFDQREDYKLVTVNNRPTSLTLEDMPGAVTRNEFGSMLASIFAAKSHANGRWDHWTLLRSRPTHVYAFAITAENSDYQITSGTRRGGVRVTVAQHGYVYIDDATGMAVRLTAVADDLPPDFDVRHVSMLLDYDFIDVGGTQYLLPLHSETTLSAPPFHHRNETDFQQYRKFSADATITYDGVKK
jgi:hypothetical protein